jgi:hypothetical protein
MININEIILEEYAKLNNLNENFRKWFGDSKVSINGEPLILYHGTNENFNDFDIDKIGYGSGNYGHYGYGFYFSDDIREAKHYGSNIIKAYLRIENPFTGTDDEIIKLKRNGVQDIDSQIINVIDFNSLLVEVRKIDKIGGILLELVRDYGLEEAWKKFNQAGYKYSHEYNELSNIADEYTSIAKDKPYEIPSYVFKELKNFGINMRNLKYGKGFKYSQSLHWITDLGNKSEEVTNVIKKLGYDGVIYGSEYIVFYPNQIKSINNDGSWDINDDNIFS